MADSKKSKLFSKYLSRMDTIKKDKYAAELFAALEAGKNSYMRIDRLESSNFDMVWIKTIENCIYDLGEIIANPKEVTKTVTSIVPVELARKTGAESVQHLASHTQYIKEITEQGDVVPNKILNIGSEEDIHTYENRFIATLIRRLVLFIEKRYEFVKKFSVLHDEEILFYKTKAIVDGSEVEIETKIKVRSESDSEDADISNSYVDRIVKLREYIMYFYGSKFMKELKTERDVRNPIVMTNILRKNPKYHKCYELFRFIEKYDKLGVSYKLDEDASMFSDAELAELNTVMLTNYLALKGKDRSKVTKGFSRTYKPRILTSLDDEQFIYGDLLRGPIEFLRVDQGYQDYLDEQLKKDLPPHPTKIEKDYYEEELEAIKARKAEKAAIDKLTKRKKKEQAEYEKQVRALIAQREKEEQERLAREADAARREEERKIEEVRQALVRDAMFGNDTNPETEEGQSSALDQPVEEPIIEEVPAEEVVEETLVEEIPEVVEEAPIEEPVSEESTEEVEEQPTEEEPSNDEPAIEEPQEVEEQPAEEVLEDEQIQEDVQEDVPSENNEQDLDAIRQQLIADALSEEEQPQEEAVEPQPEEPLEESVAEEPVVEEPVLESSEVEQVEQPQTVEEPVENNEIHLEKPVSTEKKPHQPRYIKVGNRRKPKAPKAEEQPVEQAEETEQPQEVSDNPQVPENHPVSTEKKPHQPRYIKVGNRRKPKEHKPEDNAVEEQPSENVPTEEIVVEQPVEESAIEEPVVEEPATEEKPVKKKASKKPKEVPAEDELEKVPGKFIVKTAEGYFVKPGHYSIYKHEAFVFDDFNEANRIKKEHGGKVVKL